MKDFDKLKKYYTNKMKEIYAGEYDTEEAHLDADGLMCDLLKELGFNEMVKIFEDTAKWYA